MRKIIAAGLILLQACTVTDSYVSERFAATTPEGVSTAVAHRGCWLREPDGEYYIPENSTYGIEMAARYGYPAIELDVKYTLDRKMVVMHDGTINRTMRNASDYSKIEKPVRVSDVLFEDLRSGYVLESSDPAMRTPIPTLEEMLLACRRTGVIPMLHSRVLESYGLAQKMLGDRWIAFDDNYSAMRVARSVSDCLILWDPGRADVQSTIAALDSLGGWTGMSTMKYDMQDAAYIEALQAAGHPCQSSIFPSPEEQRSLHDGVAIQLSDFFWHQTVGREPLAEVSETVSLVAGESWQCPDIDTPDFAAVTVSLNFAGSVELRVSDRRELGKDGGWQFSPRVYRLHRDTHGEESVGLRLFKTPASFEILALEDSELEVCAAVYAL